MNNQRGTFFSMDRQPHFQRSFLLVFLLFPLASGLPETSVTVSPKDKETNDDCGLNGYEAHCVLDIMEEHIEATAIVNHCNIPLDVTFRVIYRYGNGTEQRWQYTFVTTNQNERVLIPGLLLPPAPHALVYLFVRVPGDLFDLHNSSLAAIKASFVAILSNGEWEEAEFLNEVVFVESTDDCKNRQQRSDPLFYSLGGALLGLSVIGSLITVAVWCYRRRKTALDELALVSSLETGLPGAQPYQIGSDIVGNNNISKEADKENESLAVSPSGEQQAKQPPTTSGFRFGRLREDLTDQKKEQALLKMTNKAVVIGNPVLVGKASFNRVDRDKVGSKHGADVSVGDTFQNTHSVSKYERKKRTRGRELRKQREDGIEETDRRRRREEQPGDGKRAEWQNHPLEVSDENCSLNFSNGARPKVKPEEHPGFVKDDH